MNTELNTSNRTDDEINLTDLVLIVWRHRWVALIAAICCYAIMVTSTFMYSPKYYTVRSTLLPSSSMDYQGLKAIDEFIYMSMRNKEHSFSVSYRPQLDVLKSAMRVVYSDFIKVLSSSALRDQYIAEHAVDGNDEKALVQQRINLLVKSISVVPPKKLSGLDQKIVVSLKSSNPDSMAAAVNQYVEYALNQFSKHLTERLRQKKMTAIKYLESKIAGKREGAEARRQDMMVRLQDALVVAKSADIKNPFITQFNVGVNGQQNGIVDVGSGPLYLRGFKALQAELGLLKSRKNNDPYIKELRGLQELITELSIIDVDVAKVQVAVVDEPAAQPSRSSNSKKKIILIAGLLMALLVGVVLVFLIEFIRKIRREVAKS